MRAPEKNLEEQDSSLFSSSMATTKFHSVVLDANAIINAGPTSLAGLASHYFTVNEALLEIRDARARQVLSMLPFEIVTRMPCEGSVEAIRAFALKTGDLARLSKTDVLLLALTHQLEVEANGASHLRTEPLKVPTQAGLHHKREMPSCKFFASSGGCRNGSACRFKHDSACRSEEERPILDPAPEGAAAVDDKVADLSRHLGETDLGRTEDIAVARPEDATAVRGRAIQGGLQLAAPIAPTKAPETSVVEPALAAVAPAAVMPATDVHAFSTHALDAVEATLVPDDDGDGAWITPLPPSSRAAGSDSSLTTRIESAVAAEAAPRTEIVCITSDFAMQNVLLQIGLTLASDQGKLVREVKTWVLKCDACFNITDKMDKLFCPTCGNATLARLGVSIGADGAPSYHYKRHREFNTRGTVFALPTPQGGRNGGGLLLREDQLLTGKWAHQKRAQVAQEPMFGGPEGVPVGSADSSGRSRAATKHGRTTELVVGYGRTNPNATRHRK